MSKSVRTAAKLALSQARNRFRPLLRAAERGDRHYCPCCETLLRRFKPYGVIPRPNARCGVCGSVERDRLLHLYLTRATNLFDGTPKKLLHIAPEPHFERLFRGAPSLDYLSADLFDVRAMVRMDITDIQYADSSFDVIYCSHVLEHVLDDRKAIREFYRILKPTGWAILQVPITAEETFEDPSISDPRERERLFGQHDHVRCYGPDYEQRLTDGGFKVTVDDFANRFDSEAARWMGLDSSERIYFCRKAM